MKKLILLSAVFAVAGSVSGGIAKKTDNNWRKADGSADGVWSDEAHWTLGMPGAAHYAYFPGSLGSYTVMFPKGDVEIETSFRANVAEGETVTFDGRGSGFRQGAREVDTYHHEPFGFRYKGAHFFNHQQYSGADSTIARHAFSEMTNFVVRLAGDGGPKLYFDQGYLDLYKPCGSESWSALTILFAQGTGANADALPYDGVVGFGKNTETRFGTVYLQGNNRTNILEFTGGKHKFMSTLCAPDASQSMVNKETITEIRIADDAEVAFKGPMYFGHSGSYYGDTARRIFRLSVEDGGYCAVSNTLSQRDAGRLEVAVKNKAVMELSGGVTLAGIAACTATVSLADATLNINGEFKQGLSGRNASLNATNATLNISSNGSYAQISSVSEFVDCSISSENQFVVNGDSSAVFSGENGNSLFSKAFYVGRTDSSDAEVDFSGGTHCYPIGGIESFL